MILLAIGAARNPIENVNAASVYQCCARLVQIFELLEDAVLLS